MLQEQLAARRTAAKALLMGGEKGLGTPISADLCRRRERPRPSRCLASEAIKSSSCKVLLALHLPLICRWCSILDDMRLGDRDKL